MKVLTLTQPWATLVAIGAKRIETRSWATKYRGLLLIHAAAGLGPGGKEAYIERCTASEPIYAALFNAGLVPFTWDPDALLSLPLGAIVATCELVDCVPSEQITQAFGAYGPEDAAGGRTLWPLTDHELAFGDYRPGRYAWLLADVQPLPEPIPARGQLGLWEWDGVIE